MLAGSGLFLSELSSCTSSSQVIKTEAVNNRIQIPVIAFAQSDLKIIRVKGSFYDIAVQKKENNVYEALLLECTHQSNQLVPNGHGYSCNLHGSQFDKDGAVLKGPADQPLQKYPVTVEHENIIIHLKES